MNIVLTGYRCTGKTTVGRIIAQDLMRDFVDTDVLIQERTGLPIQTYVSENGWDLFRRVEREIVRDVAAKAGLVIATGGGVVMDRENVRMLRRDGWLIWLKADPSIIRKRMRWEEEAGGLRPSLSGTDSLKEVDAILSERTGFYRRASDHMEDTNQRGPEEVAQAIIKALPQGLMNVD